MNPSTDRMPVRGIAALWLLAAALLCLTEWGRIARGVLPDTDDAMRLAQVRDWLGGQGWFDLRQHRMDPAMGGADIHWSRLVDLPIAAALRLFAWAGEPAATMAATTLVPLLTLAAALALAGLVGQRLIGRAGAPLAPVVLLTAAPVMLTMVPGRIDHHGWQIVALLAAIAGLVDADRRRGGLVAGVAIAASLAIGMEQLPVLAGVALCVVAAWVADADEAPRLRAMLPALVGLGWLALMLFVPPAARWTWACDALSLSQIVPMTVGGGVLLLAARPSLGLRGRVLAVVAAGLAAALPLLLTPAGHCLADPYAAVDPLARTLWLARVTEALPLWQQPVDVALACLILPLIGLAGAVLRARHDRRWLMLAGLAVLTIGLSLLSTRAAVQAHAVAVPGAAALLTAGRAALAARRALLLRVGGTAALFLCVTGVAPRLLIARALAGPAAPAAEQGADGDCLSPAALHALDALPPATLLAPLDYSPALVAYGHHRAVAGPYHRNGRAIADVMRAWAGSDAQAKALIARHGVGYVAWCGRPSEFVVYRRRNPAGLSARLTAGQAPRWLRAVPIDRASGWHLWRVTPAA